MREEFKLKVHSANKSSDIQKIFFKLGFNWNNGDKKIKHIEKIGLFFDLSDMTITYTDDIHYFYGIKCREITLKKLKRKAFQNKIIKTLILKNLEKT